MTRVNLITGFLGSGKTTTLRHLLAGKPEGENWAVLVNEFGEIGIDGALLAESGAVLKEIPGGCMCCVNGLPMQVGLNMLLKQTRPDRLLIEPTGLGHPKQILDMLSAAVYQPWIDLRATARPLVRTSQGTIDAALLDQPRSNQQALPSPLHHHHGAPSALASLRLNEHSRWRRALNQGQGYYAAGWIFDSDTVFDTLGLLEWARLAPASRVKGVLRIAEGLVSINRQGADFHIETRPLPPPDSRIELIHQEQADWNILQTSLLNLRL